MTSEIEYEASRLASRAAAIAVGRNYALLTPREYGEAVGMSQQELALMEIFMSDGYDRRWVPLTDALLRDELTRGDEWPRTVYAFVWQVLLPRYRFGADYRVMPGGVCEISGECYKRLLMMSHSPKGALTCDYFIKIPSMLGFMMAYARICNAHHATQGPHT